LAGGDGGCQFGCLCDFDVASIKLLAR
jgi:hypothetical protein